MDESPHPNVPSTNRHSLIQISCQNLSIAANASAIPHSWFGTVSLNHFRVLSYLIGMVSTACHGLTDAVCGK